MKKLQLGESPNKSPKLTPTRTYFSIKAAAAQLSSPLNAFRNIMQTPEESHGKENIEFATGEIVKLFGVDYSLAKELAIEALDGLVARGYSARDHNIVKKVIRVVVSSWLNKTPLM